MTVASVVPTSAELSDLDLACRKLWDLDKHRLTPGMDYQLNLQRGTKPYRRGDFAMEPLFTYVKEEIFEKNTFKLFLTLLNNYERETGIVEQVTQEEKRETWEFLSAIVETAPMLYTQKWLSKKGLFSGNNSDFKRILFDLWFGLYRRESHRDSCGFEHVFVGEEREGKIIGCHNWIQMYNEERAGNFNYHGYIRPRQRGCNTTKPHENEQLVTVQFSWYNDIKPVSTSFIGVSPEFEMALYTLCHMSGGGDVEARFGSYCCNIKTHSIGRGSYKKIGTAYPEMLPYTPAQAATKIQATFRGTHVRQQQKMKKKTNNGNQAWSGARRW